jgi:hypothetical protein
MMWEDGLLLSDLHFHPESPDESDTKLVGRGIELDQIIQAITRIGSPKIVFLSGCHGAGKTMAAAALVRSTLEAAELRQGSLTDSGNLRIEFASSLCGGTGCGLGLSCLLYLLQAAAHEYSEELKRNIRFLRKLLKLLNRLIHLFLRLLAQPRFLSDLIRIERTWFLYHGDRPPRFHEQAREGLSQAIAGRMCSSAVLA